METFENSIISRRTRLKKKSFPAADIHIKQEVDIQDIYCNEDQDDITEGGENFMPEIKVELLDEDTISADEAVILKQESNFNQYLDNLASADTKNQSLEASTTAQVYPFTVLQTKIEESFNPNTKNQLDAQTFSKFFSCSVNLHKGINLSDIAKCKICQKLRQNQLNKPKSVDYDSNQITQNNKSNLWTYKKNKYQCNQCGLKFLLEVNLKKHLEWHFPSSPSRIPDVLSNYLLKYKDYKDYKLHSCIDDNDNTSDLDVGTEDFSQSENGPYQCNYCSLTFLDQCNFEKHIESHHKSIQLSESIFIQTDYKQYRCPCCGLQFLLKYNFNSHLKIHDRTIFKCLKCDKNFANQRALHMHCRSHFKEFYKCNSREKTFPQEKIQTGETYDCKDCEKTFLSQSALKYHSMIHLNGQKFKCIDCDKKFTTKISFKRHLQLHSKEKPYECTECGKEFALESYANRHYLRNHGKNRPYKYKDCDKSFSQYNLLKVHAQIHQKKT